MAKKTKKLAVKKETLWQLGALTDEQLRAAGGGGLLIYNYNTNLCLQNDSLLCAGIRTTGGGSILTVSCDTKCETW